MAKKLRENTAVYKAEKLVYSLPIGMPYKSRFKCNIGMPIRSASDTTMMTKEQMLVTKKIKNNFYGSLERLPGKK
ncbi:MAG: hypothetical protein ABI091_18250 [Ferruginibacter sp.]